MTEYTPHTYRRIIQILSFFNLQTTPDYVCIVRLLTYFGLEKPVKLFSHKRSYFLTIRISALVYFRREFSLSG